MLWFYILVGIVIALVVLDKSGVFRKEKFSEKDEPLPYRKKDYLLTIAERKFFDVLYPIAQENNWHLFVKVRLEDLFWIPKGFSKNERWSWRGRIKSRHVDFVLCDRKNIRPLIIIELNDSSHSKTNRIKRDNFYISLFSKTNLAFLEVQLKNDYNKNELELQIKDLLRYQLS